MAKPKELLDALVRQYESGDRDPALIRQLNGLAWSGFHDPWESKAPPAHPGTPSPTAESFDPSAIRPFTGETIERYLREHQFGYWKREPGSYHVKFAYSPTIDRTLTILFEMGNRNKGVFRLLMLGDRRVKADAFDKAFQLCNEWNSEFLWPRAYVEIPPSNGSEHEGSQAPASGTLALDFHLLVAEGLHQAFFDHQLADVFVTSRIFWEKAHQKYAL